MGRRATIDQDTGAALLAAYQETGSVRGAAKRVGVGLGAAQRYLSAFPANSAAAVVVQGIAEQAPQAVQQQQLVAARGAAVLTRSLELLQLNYDRLETFIGRMEKPLAQQPGADFFAISAKHLEVYVKAIAASTAHIKLAKETMELVLAAREVLAFQEAVIEAIGDADPETQQRILAILESRGAVAAALLGPTGALRASE